MHLGGLFQLVSSVILHFSGMATQLFSPQYCLKQLAFDRQEQALQVPEGHTLAGHLNSIEQTTKLKKQHKHNIMCCRRKLSNCCLSTFVALAKLDMTSYMVKLQCNSFRMSDDLSQTEVISLVTISYGPMNTLQALVVGPSLSDLHSVHSSVFIKHLD